MNDNSPRDEQPLSGRAVARFLATRDALPPTDILPGFECPDLGICFPRIHLVQGWYHNETFDGPGESAPPIFSLDHRNGVRRHGLHSGTATPLLLPPPGGNAWVVVRHHRTLAEAHAYLHGLDDMTTPDDNHSEVIMTGPGAFFSVATRPPGRDKPPSLFIYGWEFLLPDTHPFAPGEYDLRSAVVDPTGACLGGWDALEPET